MAVKLDLKLIFSSVTGAALRLSLPYFFPSIVTSDGMADVIAAFFSSTVTGLSSTKDISHKFFRAYRASVEDAVRDSGLELDIKQLDYILQSLELSGQLTELSGDILLKGCTVGTVCLEDALTHIFEECDVYIEYCPEKPAEISAAIIHNMKKRIMDDEELRSLCIFLQNELMAEFIRNLYGRFSVDEEEAWHCFTNQRYAKKVNMTSTGKSEGSHYAVQTKYYLSEIDRQLFPSLHSRLTSKAYTQDGKKAPLTQVLEEYILTSLKEEPGNTPARIWLHGSGGMGKSTSLLELMQELLRWRLFTVHIPLHSLTDSYRVKEYMAESVFDGNLIKTQEFYDSTGQSSRMVYLLDGYNEVADINLPLVNDEILRLCRTDAHIVIASRTIIPGTLLENFPESLEILPLEREAISRYLSQRKMALPQQSSNLWDILSSPLMLVLYTQSTTRYTTLHGEIDWKKENNAGTIIWNFFQCEYLKLLQENQVQDTIRLTSLAAVSVVAPYLAWRMAGENRFSIKNSRQLTKWLQDCFSLCREYEKEDCESSGFLPDQLCDYRWQDDNLAEVKKVLLRQHVLVSAKSNEEYGFVHQTFRDCLAAAHCLNAAAYGMRRDPEAWSKYVLSRDILEFVAQLDETDAPGLLWRRTGGGGEMPEQSRTMFNLISYFRIKYNGNLSRIDFSGKDLRRVSLNGLRLVDKDICADFSRCKISGHTFLPLGHRYSVTHIAVSGDGRVAVSCDKHGYFMKWDMYTGDARTQFKVSDYIGYPDKVCFALSYKGNFILIGTSRGKLAKCDISGDECKTVYSRDMEGEIYDITITKNGQSATFSCAGMIVQWDIDQGISTDSIPISVLYQDKAVDVKHRSRRNIQGKLLEPLRERPEGPLGRRREHGEEVKPIKTETRFLSPDGNVMAVCCEDSGISLLDTATRECLCEVKDCRTQIIRLWFVMDGSYVVCMDKYNQIYKFGTKSGNLEGNIPPFGEERLTSAAVTQDGKYVLCGYQNGTLVKWDIDRGEIFGFPWRGYKKGITCVTVTKDDRFVISGQEDGELTRWDITDGRPSGETWKAHSASVDSLDITPDGKYVFSCASDGLIIKWRVEDGSPVGLPWDMYEGIISEFDTSISVDIEGKYLARASKNGQILRHDLQTRNIVGGELVCWPYHKTWISYMRVLRGGRYAAICFDYLVYPSPPEQHTVITIWKTAGCDFNRASVLKCPVKSKLTVMAISPDQEILAAGFWDGMFVRWNRKTREMIGEPWMGDSSASDILISPDNQFMFSCGRGITRWEFQNGCAVLVWRAENFKSGIECLAMTSDAKYVIGGLRDGGLVKVDALSGDVLQIFRKINGCSLAGCRFCAAEFEDENLKELVIQSGAIV